MVFDGGADALADFFCLSRRGAKEQKGKLFTAGASKEVIATDQFFRESLWLALSIRSRRRGEGTSY